MHYTVKNKSIFIYNCEELDNNHSFVNGKAIIGPKVFNAKVKKHNLPEVIVRHIFIELDNYTKISVNYSSYAYGTNKNQIEEFNEAPLFIEFALINSADEFILLTDIDDIIFTYATFSDILNAMWRLEMEPHDVQEIDLGYMLPITDDSLDFVWLND